MTSWDVSGIWYGTSYTDGLTHAQGLQGDGEGWGGPPQTYNVSLFVTWQSAYTSYGYGQVVSTIAAQLDGMFWYSVPVSGFVDDKGLVKLTFYIGSASEEWTFDGHLTGNRIQRRIVGKWTRMSWSNGIFLHQFGTLDLSQHGLKFSDQAVSAATLAFNP